MKKKIIPMITILISLFLLIEAGDFKPPVTEPGENGWENYVNAPIIDKAIAKGLNPGQESPEAAIVHFYASRIRGDNAYIHVLLPEEKRSKKLNYSLEKSKDWKFIKFQLVGKKKVSANRDWIRIYIEVAIKGKKDGGKDEADLGFIDGKWYVYTVPA